MTFEADHARRMQDSAALISELLDASRLLLNFLFPCED